MALFKKKENQKETQKKVRLQTKKLPIDEISPGQTMVRPKSMPMSNQNNYLRNLRKITNRIHSAPHLDSILIDLKDDILSLLDAERITIYVMSENEREIFSKFKDGDEIQEIRVAVDNKSISGYVANNKKPLAIQDAYNAEELANIDPELRFNRDYDVMSGFRTKHVLTVPVILDDTLHGIIQLINKKSGERFLSEDKQAVMEMAETLAIAFNNHRKLRGKQLSKFDLLVAENLILQKELEEAIQSGRESGQPLEKVLMEDYKVAKENIGKALQNFYRVPFFCFKSGIPIPYDMLKKFDPNYLRNNMWVPIDREENKVTIAIDNPKALDKIDDIKRMVSARSYRFMVALPQDLLKTIDYFWGADKAVAAEEEEGVSPEFSEILEELDEEQGPVEIDDFQDVDESDNVVIRMVNRIIKDAYEQGASDIHIEPSPIKNEKMVVRFRVDGTCFEYQRLPASAKRAVASRIKVMADLDIANRRMPQDGKIQFKKFGGLNIELRVATLPTVGENESVVLRILASSKPIPLDKIGMRPHNLKRFKEIIARPYGIVLVVGPTGSGKTTTLHSVLGYINTPERKIWTAEDPVEITQIGLSQVQIHPKAGYTFPMAMRAFLRADPDVIMVGEMRDFETASIGVEASLTGHLVFSTLHTNSAPETIIRLLDMGIDPFNFGDALLGILAQRLVRTLCPDCREAIEPGEEFFMDLMREFDDDENFRRQVPCYPETVNQAKGCKKCNKGYKGRMGIHELLGGSSEVTKLIHDKATADELRRLAVKQGMTTLKQDGILKVIDGHTDIHQVRSVCIM